jgi:hypothetical protein
MEKLFAAINAEEARAPRPRPISGTRFLPSPHDRAREKPALIEKPTLIE